MVDVLTELLQFSINAKSRISSSGAVGGGGGGGGGGRPPTNCHFYTSTEPVHVVTCVMLRSYHYFVYIIGPHNAAILSNYSHFSLQIGTV